MQYQDFMVNTSISFERFYGQTIIPTNEDLIETMIHRTIRLYFRPTDDALSKCLLDYWTQHKSTKWQDNGSPDNGAVVTRD